MLANPFDDPGDGGDAEPSGHGRSRAAVPPADGHAMTVPHPRPAVILAGWVILLAASLLPVVIAQEVLGRPLDDDLRLVIAVGAIAAGIGLAFLVEPLRGLRPFLWLLLVLVSAQWFVHARLDRLPEIASRLADPSFAVYMPVELLLNLIVTAAVIALLLVVRRDRRAFFLAKGDLSAPAEPIRWLGVRPGTRWNVLGRDLSVLITLGTVAFLVIYGQPTADLVVRALPLLPVVLVAAAVNAFNEEVTYKASLLSVLVEPVGRRQALWMVAAYFGIAHYYGVPYGLVGVAMAAFLGWILGRSMLETRGLGWAWFIHFVQDVAIFGFMALGAITPGGG